MPDSDTHGQPTASNLGLPALANRITLGSQDGMSAKEAAMANELPVGLTCKHCGQLFGMIFTPITPKTTPLIAACAKCVGEAMGGKPATNAEDWKEVEKKL